MTKILLRILLSAYRKLPDWFVRSVVFFLIGLAFTVALIFLSIKPTIRRFRTK